MRRSIKLLGLAGLLGAVLFSTRALAQDAAEVDEGDVGKKASVKAAPPPVTPSVAKPKIGDVSTSGYLRGGFGASNQKGRMTCFQLAIPGSLVSKYRLGNECEVWGEFQFTTVVYADDDDDAVARLHFMPTVYIPTTYLGYSPTGAINSPAQFTTSTGAVLSFPNLYVDMKGISWLGGGSAWIGTRYYKRESVYISDFFYWNPSGVGGGIEDIHLGKDLRLSYAIFAVDGEPGSPSDASSPPLPLQVDFGVRHDLQLRGVHPWESGEFQVGFQVIMDMSNNTATHSGWGATVQYVQKVLGGENKAAFQYGRGGGTGFGTLARFYYPDFSVRHELSESRRRFVDVLTVQPTEWFGTQAVFVYQHDDLGTQGGVTNWYSTGGRASVALSKHFKVLGEAGYDYVQKSNGSDPQWLAKFTIAPAIAAGKQAMHRPELRVFGTWATWNASARGATIDSGRLYTNTNLLSGITFGMQAETLW